MILPAYLLQLCFNAPHVVAKGKKMYPQRSNEDAALLEWGHSAIIHAADAVVAQFGLQASEEEFELGIEASPVIGRPPQGCEPFRNAAALISQVGVVAIVSRGGRGGRSYSREIALLTDGLRLPWGLRLCYKGEECRCSRCGRVSCDQS